MSRSYVAAYQSSLSLASDVQYVECDTERFDTDSYHSTSANKADFVLPCTGYYLALGHLAWPADPGSTHLRYSFFTINGSQGNGTNGGTNGGSSAFIPTLETGMGSWETFNAMGGDVLSLGAYSVNGTFPATVASQMAVLRLHPDDHVCSLWFQPYANVQGITTGAANIVSFPRAEDELIDGEGMHSTSSNTGRITVPEAGVYMVMHQSVWEAYAGNPTGTTYLTVSYGGAAPTSTDAAVSATMQVDIGNRGASGAVLLTLSAGDYVQLMASHNAAATRNLNGAALAVFKVDVGACAIHSSAQTLSASTWTTLAGDAEYSDTGTIHSMVTNNSRLTAPADGAYMIWGTANFSNAGAAQVGIRFRKNGTDTSYDQYGYWPTATGGYSGYGILELTAGDYMEVQAWSTNPAANCIGAYGANFGMIAVPDSRCLFVPQIYRRH